MRYGWSQEVAEQGLAALSVVGGDGHLRVEVEAVEARLAARGQEYLTVEVVRSELGGAARGGGLGVGLGQRALVVLEVRDLCVFEEPPCWASLPPCASIDAAFDAGALVANGTLHEPIAACR